VKSEFDVSNIREFPKVDIVYSYIEPSVTMIQALHSSGVKGIVFAGTGAGGLSNFQKEAVKTIMSSPSESKLSIRACLFRREQRSRTQEFKLWSRSQ
jgi:L-asparaginase